ncbi:MAG: YccF domain-containing protein [Mycoplasmataceae bacterium]|jgi:uncharacterized membrane protein YccF (DUF307 family)|nr:YccF domain-containing protein [Mycoplasmataceae bacterium]
MKTLGNILWFVFYGFWQYLALCLAGVILCITLIGIPFGVAMFKIAKSVLAPFGKLAEVNYKAHPIMNTIWVILAGWMMFLSNLIWAGIFCITIIGIPFGKQIFKIAKVCAFPFGSSVSKSPKKSKKGTASDSSTPVVANLNSASDAKAAKPAKK